MFSVSSDGVNESSASKAGKGVENQALRLRIKSYQGKFTKRNNILEKKIL